MEHAHTIVHAPETSATPHVTVRFPVEGRRLPADHGYALYSAITRLLPAVRWLNASEIATQLIRCILSDREIVMNALRQSQNSDSFNEPDYHIAGHCAQRFAASVQQ